MSDIEIFVITECNVAQAALWILYEVVYFECQLPPSEVFRLTTT